MIATITVLVLCGALLAWMWIFELRLAHLLDYAEQLVDRQHGPALAPEVRAEEKPQQPATAPELPAQPKPAPGPRTVPTEVVIDTWLEEQRARLDKQIDDWRAEQDALTAPKTTRKPRTPIDAERSK